MKPKTKLYGNRWKIKSSGLGRGGQSEVFTVTDATGLLQGEYALKRVLNVSRRQRFRQEIDAIKRLRHPNIISLIDHSLLETEDGEPADKQYIVMPIAKGGDLTRKERLAFYKDSIEATLQVASQLAQALYAAHQAGIVHRDVKPANILFTDNGHEVWLADFGVCLVRDVERATETGEVVGPRSFMAPELEDGGQLSVSPAADIYSLGKLIFYMISGGVTLPRERLHEAPFIDIFAKGERFTLLRLLLDKMISPIGTRLQTMNKVIEELENLRDWEQTAKGSLLDEAALQGLDSLRKSSIEARTIADMDSQARETERRGLELATQSVMSWLEAELSNTAQAIHRMDFPSDVLDLYSDGYISLRMAEGESTMTTAIGARTLTLAENAEAQQQHLLHVFLCRTGINPVRVLSDPKRPRAVPPQDFRLALIPAYGMGARRKGRIEATTTGFFIGKDKVNTSGIVMLGPRYRPSQPTSINWKRLVRRHIPEISMHSDFRVSEWPSARDRCRSILTEAVGSFLAVVQGDRHFTSIPGEV